jgi:predicted DNA-binding protein (MmcQ/YjbR family)
MKARKTLMDFCLTLAGAYEDYPFDFEIPAMRHRGNRKIFALFLEHDGRQLLNLKCEPFMAMFWRDAFNFVIPACHMNKEHWNSVVLDGAVPLEIVKDMIADSYRLTVSIHNRDMGQIRPEITQRHIEQNLASHILSLIARRTSADWEAKYGHGLVLAEHVPNSVRAAETSSNGVSIFANDLFNVGTRGGGTVLPLAA